MLIAQAKRKENIAEYLLYLWQIEDLIRAYQLDMDKIERDIIARYDVDDATRKEIRDWYESLVKMMELEHVKDRGHLQICKNVLIRLHDLHVEFLNHPDRFASYRAAYYDALPIVVELRARTPEDMRVDEIETAFNALYGGLILKLQGREITPATQQALDKLSKWLGTLAALFRRNEEQPLFEEQPLE